MVSIYKKDESRELTLTQKWKDKEWLESITSAKFATHLESMQVVLQELFPDRWDFKISKNEKHVDNNTVIGSDGLRRSVAGATPLSAKYSFFIVIHFPELKVHNNKKMFMNVKDYYSLIPFKHNILDDRIDFSQTQGVRLTFTKEEASSGYLHSHLPSGMYLLGDFIDPRNYCEGSGYIHQARISINQGYNDDVFKMYLLSVASTIKYESLEGRPHIRMENVFNKLTNGSTAMDLSTAWTTAKFIIKMNMYRETNLPVTYRLEDKYIVVDDDKLERYCTYKSDTSVDAYANTEDIPNLPKITEAIRKGTLNAWDSNSLKSSEYYLKNSFYYKGQSGEYYSIKGDSNGAPEYSKDTFIFRGEHKSITVHGHMSESAVKTKFYINPLIKHYVKRILEHRANKETLRHSIITWLHQSSDA